MPYTYKHFGFFRFLLAFLVMFQHFSADAAPDAFAARFLPYQVGSIAVLVFFALSGFVITEAADRVYKDKPLPFFTNRLLRIVPHFAVAISLSMLLHYVFLVSGGIRLWRLQPSFPYEIAFSAQNLAFNFVSIFPAIHWFVSYNFLDITWAVRVEMAFYIVVFAYLALGRVSSWARRFGPVLIGAALLLLFVVIVDRGSLSPLVYVPYFAFGSALYFATMGHRLARWIAVGCLPAMAWQYVTGALHTPTVMAAAGAIWTNLLILSLLMALMVILAFGRFSRFRAGDRFFGNVTYPLYLYHENVLIFLLTFTTGYSYGMLVGGLLLSVLVSVGFYAAIDPVINRYRDRVRGRAVVENSEAPFATGHAARPLPRAGF